MNKDISVKKDAYHDVSADAEEGVEVVEGLERRLVQVPVKPVPGDAPPRQRASIGGDMTTAAAATTTTTRKRESGVRARA